MYVEHCLIYWSSGTEQVASFPGLPHFVLRYYTERKPKNENGPRNEATEQVCFITRYMYMCMYVCMTLYVCTFVYM